MKILIAGDTHGNTSHVSRLLDIAHAQGCLRVVQLGDFGAWEHMADGREFMRDVSKRASRYGIPLVWIDGNHDKWSRTMDLHGAMRSSEGFVICAPYVLYAPRGHRWEWDGIRFMSLGGAYSVDKAWRLDMERDTARKRANRTAWKTGQYISPKELPDTSGTLWFPEEELTDEQVDTAIGDGSPVDVLLTHDKPRSSNPGWNRKDLPECWPNQDRVQRVVRALQPHNVFHGHLHYPYTDTIRIGDVEYCTVHGLDADPSSAEGPGYDSRNSWMIVETDDLRAELFTLA